MRKTIKNIALTLFVLSLSITSALAQNCQSDYEAIVKLRTPKLGSFTVWDGVLGEKEFKDEFMSVAALDNNNVMIAGTREANNQTNVGPTLLGKKLVIGEIDLRGRMIWQKHHDITGLDTIHDMTTHDKGTIVIASRKLENRRHRDMVVLFFGSNGTLYKTKSIQEVGHDIQPASIIQAHDKKSLLIVASAFNRKTGSRYSLFYRLSPKGSILKHRALKTGLDNQLLHIAPTHGDAYIATGHIQGENGLASGWVLKMTQDADIIWQRSYVRGAGSRIMAATNYSSKHIAVGGQVLSSDKKTGSAGWLMMLDSDRGDTIWQRYYHGEDRHYAVDDIVLSDKSDFMSVMINMFPTFAIEGALAESNTRVLSVGSQGKIYDLQDYSNGEGAQAKKMILNKRHDRVMVGTTEVAYQIQEEGQESDQKPRFEHSHEGWVIAAPKPETYRDPCRSVLLKPKDTSTATPTFETIFP